MNELLLYGTVGSSFWEEEYFTAAQVRERLGAMSGPVTVRVNSGGGIATEGQAIYNALRDYADSVTVIIDGIAASAASLIAMAGDVIRMPAGAILMIHDPASFWVEGRGTEDDHLHAAKSLRVIAEAYAGIYARRAGISKDEAREFMRAETYFDGPGALAPGFATETDEDGTADAPAAFDYRIYSHAPEPLRAVAGGLPRRRARASVLAMMAGAANSADKKGNPMPKPKATATTAAQEDEDTTLEEEKGGGTGEAVDPEDPENPEDPEAAGDWEGDPDPEEEEELAAAESAAITILSICSRRGLPAATAQEFIRRGLRPTQTVAELNGKGSKLRTRSNAPTARILRDERETRRAGMTAAICAQISRREDVTGPARQYMGMSLIEMVAASIDHRGPTRTFGDRNAVLMAASLTTSDFPAIFQNALNKQLLERYQLAEPTYRRIARQKNFRDFRPMPLIRTGDFPALQPIGEAGEIKWGKFGESQEQALIAPYAVGVTISRRMIIDDELGAIDEVLGSYGEGVAAWEEQMFYKFALTAKMADGKAVFHADHGNLAAAAAAINPTSVSLGRAAMRKQKSIDGNTLNITPNILLVGPDKETEAEILIAAITPASPADVNPFSGRLSPVVTAQITGNSWYLLSERNPCWVYGYIEGMEAPRLRTEELFGSQGFSMTLEHDFGLGAADHRGGYKNAGA